ncbi:protein arginine N-methyltransferase 7 isoform X1 [Ostrinia furnacalis]|uniref:protein arginine N-methyltransferase 7 isoform X1 n=2 Tax=Ostrinia furnacalis TaxID=93504 RepID=UPI00103F2B9F|nr:protein arginine N-methyltransferase 7 isoform X1 [Ostrinia furnacalis]
MTFILNYRCRFVVNTFIRLKSSLSRHQVKMQVFTQKRNPLTGSTEWDVQHEDYDYHQEIARSAFADMLHDTERNKKYYRALQLAIEKMHNDGKKANVLDIGTGTGLLSIMAAKCGADSIVACEAFEPMAECCLKILARNGVADKITVIPKRSTDITVGENGDMKEKANILVTEVFDTELIGEGALSTFSHAHKFLLEEDCIVVPDSAVIYAQVVECPTMQKWNKLNDLADEDLQIVLRTPQKMKDCPGSAAVHDIQLSQLPRTAFRELSDPIPVFYYDWSGRTAIDMKRTVKQEFTVTSTGKAQMVFMSWELNMDTEGKIGLSCAPWWAHPDADMSSERPQDSIPWRDHWMQAVYYLPQEITLNKNSEITLISCQDEYSLWFYLEDQNTKPSHYKRPVCECGVHMALSRTHVSYLNDGKRSKKFLNQIREEMGRDAVFLDFNGSSVLGLAAASMGAKTVYIIENTNMHIGILEDYIKENSLTNVKIIPEPNDEVLKEVTNVISDPNFSSAILPWENLKMAYILYKFKDKLRENVSLIPEGCEFWAMPVEFQDLHKIRIPLGKCEGIDMSVFDSLVESSRIISDAEIEAQPLWEYPCKCRGVPRKLLEIDFSQLKATYAGDDTHALVDTDTEASPMNGFALWAVWKIGGKQTSAGPLEWPTVGERVQWDPHTRQAVKILKKTQMVSGSNKWTYQVACDLERGQFNVSLDLVPEE